MLLSYFCSMNLLRCISIASACLKNCGAKLNLVRLHEKDQFGQQIVEKTYKSTVNYVPRYQRTDSVQWCVRPRYLLITSVTDDGRMNLLKKRKRKSTWVYCGKKSLLCPENKQKSLQWLQKHCNSTVADFKKVLRTDKSKFNIRRKETSNYVFSTSKEELPVGFGVAFLLYRDSTKIGGL